MVFSTLRESTCAECSSGLAAGDFLVMEQQRTLCLACADLDHLVFLPSGDAALTRRGRKHSTLSAVAVRFSRARKRYERQGLLVEHAGFKRAEEECLSDADQRARHRERGHVRRAGGDQALVERMAAAIARLSPGCPAAEARHIAEHAAVRGSRRVGRSAAGRDLEEGALIAAVVAHGRHGHMPYDQLLMDGGDRDHARQRVREEIDEVLEHWRASSEAEAEL